MSVDPLTKNYPTLTPYQFASNMPIRAIDLDGLEALDVTDANFEKIAGIVKESPNSVTIKHIYQGTTYLIHYNPNGPTTDFGFGLKYGGMETSYLLLKGLSHSRYDDPTDLFTTHLLPKLHWWENEDNIRNTFRHFIGQALYAAAFGEEYAKDLGDYHERDNIDDNKGIISRDNITDLINNHHAREFAKEMGLNFSEFASSEQALVDFLNAAVVRVLSSIDRYKNDPRFAN